MTATNGANGAKKPAVTEQFAQLAAKTTFSDLDAKAVAKLKDLVIDHLGVSAGAAASSESTASFVKAINSIPGSTGGKSTVYKHGHNYNPQYAALLNGTFAHSFDFDDTLAIGVIHPGASIIPATIAQAELINADGKAVLSALAVGYEVTCRLGRALSTGAYSRGFHNTATAGLMGSIAAIGNLRKLPASTIFNALGLAGSQAAGSMQFLEDGSWNKRMHPGWAAHTAFVSVALAEAGVVGSKDILEGKFGFLHAYTDREMTTELFEELVHNLGSEWLFVLTALKPFPACRFTHTAIELTARAKAKAASAELPKSIEVRISPATFNIVGTPNENKRHPINVVDAQFSMYYQVAVVWIFGDATGWGAYDQEKLQDPKIAELANRITVVADPSVPDCGARVAVDGEPALALDFPLAEDENPWSTEGVKGKFRSLAVPVYGDKTGEQIIDVVYDVENKTIGDLVALL